MDSLRPKEARILIRWLKDGPPGAIPITHENQSRGALQAVTWDDVGDRNVMERLGRWHQAAFAVFGVPAQVTPSGARQWLMEQILEAPERLLFWVKDASGRVVGHIGLARFDFTCQTVELRDVVHGEEDAQPLMHQAVQTLRGWARESFGLWVEDVGERLAAA